MHDPTDAAIVMARCDELARCSEEAERITRRFATDALRQATDLVGGWMRAAGMTVRSDNIGNVIGRYDGGDPQAKTLLLGSHLDSVRDAGKYDGPLGVIVALVVVARLHRAGRRLPFAIEVLAFADEEGLRFHTAYLGSSVVTGTFDPAWLDLIDEDGITMADAIRAFGGDPARLAQDQRRRDDLLGYCEVHIEQGPVLESYDPPVGVVTAIAGQSRFNLDVIGFAGHAGTVPMRLRQDALCAAAEFVLAAEALARETEELVATIGQIAVQPGASNVIPGHAALSLDVRHQDDRTRATAIERLRTIAGDVAERRRVDVVWKIVQESRSVPCSERFAELLATAIADAGYPVQRLPSGAGHDGVIMSTITPIAMLFVRCKGGISHNPAESVAEADVAVTIDVLERFLDLMAVQQAS